MAKDLYFDSGYGKLYERIEKGIAKIFAYESKDGKVINQFIIREIPEKIDGKIYFDIVTPYGYGGPIIETLTGDKEKLINEFEKEFSKYCLENNIVSEFVRFHPIFKNYQDFGRMYNAIYMRKTLITKLDEENPIKNQFKKSCRKNIRQAMNRGVSYKITERPQDLNKFKEIYYITMKRNNASNFYFFDDEYFDTILNTYKDNIVLVEAIFEDEVIAAGLYFTFNDVIHVHLTGTLNEYLYLAPEYILRYAITLWGIENKYKLIHNGGGRTNSEDDTLYLFKRNFATLYDLDFYIGKKIWNNKIYKELCDMKNIDINESYFPAYRKV